MRQFSIDYEQVAHKYLASYDALQRFFAPNPMTLIQQHNEQRLDFDGLRGRLLSSSYIPKAGDQARRHDAGTAAAVLGRMRSTTTSCSNTTPRSTTDIWTDEQRSDGALFCGPSIWDAASARHRIVNDISLDVHRGELLGIVGASGSGKSSLLRLLNRLDEPTSGTSSSKTRTIAQIAPRELRRRVGMVTQRPFLFPGDVASNLRFGPAQRGETLADGEIASLLERVGLRRFCRAQCRQSFRRRAATGFAGARAGESSGDSAARRANFGSR